MAKIINPITAAAIPTIPSRKISTSEAKTTISHIPTAVATTPPII